MQDLGITVIIAAFNASMTIAEAVKSALAQREVTEVIVVDDASQDDTAKLARAAADSDRRFDLIQFPTNQGPSAARNAAIKATCGPYISILDADDIFLPNRFTALLDVKDWDIIADNIVFFRTQEELSAFREALFDSESPNNITVNVGLKDFVEGNIPIRNRRRSELGFIKPIIRRSFLEQHGLHYKEDCRLGEDFIIYTQCLIKGARLKISNNIGYAALIRDDSLSAGHRIEDLRTLMSYSQTLAKEDGLTPAQRGSIVNHSNSTLRRLRHREVLQTRRERGLFNGILEGAKSPKVFLDILNDKRSKQPNLRQTPRRLFEDMLLEKFRDKDLSA